MSDECRDERGADVSGLHGNRLSLHFSHSKPTSIAHLQEAGNGGQKDLHGICPFSLANELDLHVTLSRTCLYSVPNSSSAPHCAGSPDQPYVTYAFDQSILLSWTK